MFFPVDCPSEHRLEALQAAVMLMPDENREVLQSLLLFLSDMAQYSEENQVSNSRSEISSTMVVWTCDAYENNNEIEHKLEMYFKGSC